MMGSRRRALGRARPPRLRSGAAAGHRPGQTIDGAIASGFALRAPGGDALDILTPASMSNAVRAPIVDALLAHKREVVAISRAADLGGGRAQQSTPLRRGRWPQ